jgi:hypothetical protein
MACLIAESDFSALQLTIKLGDGVMQVGGAVINWRIGEREKALILDYHPGIERR